MDLTLLGEESRKIVTYSAFPSHMTERPAHIRHIWSYCAQFRSTRPGCALSTRLTSLYCFMVRIQFVSLNHNFVINVYFNGYRLIFLCLSYWSQLKYKNFLFFDQKWLACFFFCYWLAWVHLIGFIWNEAKQQQQPTQNKIVLTAWRIHFNKDILPRRSIKSCYVYLYFCSFIICKLYLLF